MEKSFSNILKDYQAKNGYSNAEMSNFLGTSERMYAVKTNHQMIEGFSLGTLQDICGHASDKMTKGYITELKGVQMKEVLEKAPSFQEIEIDFKAQQNIV